MADKFLESYVIQHKQAKVDGKKDMSAAQSDNISSLVEEGLFDQVTELLYEYSKTLVPSGKILYCIWHKLSLSTNDVLKDFLFRNLCEFHCSFRDYLSLFKKDIYHIIQDKIGTDESRWLRENLMREYLIDGKNSIIQKVNRKHLMLYLKSIWKNSRNQSDIVEWFEFIGYMSLKEDEYGYLDDTDAFISSLDSDGIINFSSLISNIYFKILLLDSYCQGISNLKNLQEEFDLQKIYVYAEKGKPYKKNSVIFSTVLGLLMVDWVQMNPEDLDKIGKVVKDSTLGLPLFMMPLF
jgi:hypothetical protein